MVLPGVGPAAETVAPVLLTPAIFVYGELMPKNLYYASPNSLLRRAAGLFLFFNVVFAPAAALLWFLGRCLQRLVGEGPAQVQLRLARQELMGVFEEGHEAGLLEPAQRRLAQETFQVANQAISHLVMPVGRQTCVFPTMEKTDVLRLARRHRRGVALVLDTKTRRIVGYVRVVDVYLTSENWLEASQPVVRIPSSTSHLAALVQLQTDKQPIAEVVNEKGESLGSSRCAACVTRSWGEFEIRKRHPAGSASGVCAAALCS